MGIKQSAELWMERPKLFSFPYSTRPPASSYPAMHDFGTPLAMGIGTQQLVVTTNFHLQP
jgi:hypothetical protein